MKTTPTEETKPRKSETRSISFSPSLLKKLDQRAKKLKRSRSWLVNEIARVELAKVVNG